MEDKALTLDNGSDAVEITAAGDGPAVLNGFASEKNQTPTLNQTQEEEKNDGGSDDIIKHLEQEIQKLRRGRSELQGKLEETLAEMERSEVEKKAVAYHASYLEGELVRTQEDLAASSSVAEDAEAVARGLRQAVQDLEAEKASLVASKAALESQIRGLEERMAYAVTEADLAVEREKAASMNSKREGDISVLELKSKALEEQVRLLKEEKEAVEEVVERRASREEELEKVVKELKERNSELEGKIDGLVSKIDRDLDADQKKEEVEVATAKGLKVSWAVAGAAVASTAAVAVAVTTIYLRHARQR